MTQPRRRLSIFARTFLVLAAALLLAQGVGAGLILLRTPIFDIPVHPPEIIALLSTQMPTANKNISVTTQASLPAPPQGQNRDRWIEGLMAHWMGLDSSRVRFYRSGSIPPPPPREGVRTDRLQPSGKPSPPSSPTLLASSQQPQSLWPVPDIDQDFNAGEPQLLGFTAAAQQNDGRWRVVSAPGPRLSGAFKLQFSLLVGAGLLLMLPLAWWFSRALSAPIQRFSEAADQLGRNPDAGPLPRRGPAEIVQAADSFNAMQARLNRMVHERTRMIAAIAHDLRTPLARLTFRMESVPEPIRSKTLADIEEMKAMISATLDFIKNGARRGQHARIDFQLLVESVVDNLADTGADTRLMPGDAVDLDGDPLALRRMVTNLIDNALKYGKCARVWVRREGSQCLLWVDDDGPGIDPNQSEHLLQPFVRGESSRNRDTGGIGLGLAVANGIVLAHGGDISLNNRSQGGLRVSVRLPCHPA